MLAGSRIRQWCVSAVLWLGIGMVGCLSLVTEAVAEEPAPKPDAEGRHIEQVTVAAPRDIERSVLDRIVIPKFVESHGKRGERVNQVARWRTPVCPATLGLDPSYDEGISRRVVDLARSVGAPTRPGGGCTTNVEIIFTAKPQDELDWVSKHRPGLLGFHRTSLKQAATSTHAIQAWYVTGTRSFGTSGASLIPGSTDAGGGDNAAPIEGGRSDGGAVTLDTNLSPLYGPSGNHMGGDLTSEIVNIVIVVDANKVGSYSLRTLANYIAMLALTRSSLDDCNELPSIMDLLSENCGTRVRTSVITDADIAYLKALYSANLEKQGAVHDRMLKQISGP